MSSSYSSATSHQQLTLLCSKCDTACSVADSVPNGAKSFASRMHLDCKAIYRSHMARMKTHDKLKSWWTQTSEAEKKEWFRKQRQASQSSGRGHTRTFDDYQFEEWQEKMVIREQAANIDWVPFSKYETHWLIRQKSSSWIAAEWERLLKDPATWGEADHGALVCARVRWLAVLFERGRTHCAAIGSGQVDCRFQLSEHAAR